MMQWLRNIWARRPRLVWPGDEIDVGVTFTDETLDPSDPHRSLFSGRMAEVEAALLEAGIKFDRGIGLGGRDWEWDWSLSGPISVRFRCLAKKPENRRARPTATTLH